jgi:hypothetical protein
VKRLIRPIGLFAGVFAAGIAVALAVGRDDAGPGDMAPPLRLVEQGIAASGHGPYHVIASRAFVLAPGKQPGYWTLAGEARVATAAGALSRKPYTAQVQNLCDGYGQRRCWALVSLRLGERYERVTASAPSKNLHGGGRVLGVQRRLRALGFDPGPLDGKMGPRTRKAIVAYQRARGLSADGRPTGGLLDRLEVSALFSRGLGYFKAGDYHRAMGAYGRIIELRPKSSDAYFNRGLVYRRLALDGLAIQDYDTALALRPDHSRAFLDRGNAHFAQGRYGGAAWDYAGSLTSWLFGARAFEGFGQEVTTMTQSIVAVFKG